MTHTSTTILEDSNSDSSSDDSGYKPVIPQVNFENKKNYIQLAKSLFRAVYKPKVPEKNSVITFKVKDTNLDQEITVTAENKNGGVCFIYERIKVLTVLTFYIRLVCLQKNKIGAFI